MLDFVYPLHISQFTRDGFSLFLWPSCAPLWYLKPYILIKRFATFCNFDLNPDHDPEHDQSLDPDNANALSQLPLSGHRLGPSDVVGGAE